MRPREALDRWLRFPSPLISMTSRYSASGFSDKADECGKWGAGPHTLTRVGFWRIFAPCVREGTCHERSAKPMTIDDFVSWEEQQELKYEFDGFAAEPRTGGSVAHADIQGNLLGACALGCEASPAGFRQRTQMRTDASVRYRDALITCTRADPNSTIAPDPSSSSKSSRAARRAAIWGPRTPNINRWPS